MDQSKAKAPGLKWRKRASGAYVPYWFADAAAVKAGFKPKAVNLGYIGEDTIRLVARCEALTSELKVWRARLEKQEFDGSFKSLLNAYQIDPHSSFRVIRPSTRHTYAKYLKPLIEDIGERRLEFCDGRDVMGWFARWRKSEDGRDLLPKARMVLAILKAAVKFGVIARFKGCAEFYIVLGSLEFQVPPPRSHAPSAAQIVAAREAAHAAGFSSRALVYALQFETTLRQGDIIGEWAPLSDPRPAAVLGSGKWFGLSWSDVGQDLVINRFTPSKTRDTSKATVSFDLKVCPMVMEEIAKIAPEKCTGPMIVNEATKLPYQSQAFRWGWRADFAAAGIPSNIWNRDVRAGGITEGGKAGATKDDRRKLAGHSDEKTTEIYDRDTVEAHRRVMAARKGFRDKNKP